VSLNNKIMPIKILKNLPIGLGDSLMRAVACVVEKVPMASSPVVLEKSNCTFEIDYKFRNKDISMVGRGAKLMLGQCRFDGTVFFPYDGFSAKMPLEVGETILLGGDSIDAMFPIDVVSPRRNFLMSVLKGLYGESNSGPAFAYSVFDGFVFCDKTSYLVEPFLNGRKTDLPVEENEFINSIGELKLLDYGEQVYDPDQDERDMLAYKQSLERGFDFEEVVEDEDEPPMDPSSNFVLNGPINVEILNSKDFPFKRFGNTNTIIPCGDTANMQFECNTVFDFMQGRYTICGNWKKDMFEVFGMFVDDPEDLRQRLNLDRMSSAYQYAQVYFEHLGVDIKKLLEDKEEYFTCKNIMYTVYSECEIAICLPFQNEHRTEKIRLADRDMIDTVEYDDKIEIYPDIIINNEEIKKQSLFPRPLEIRIGSSVPDDLASTRENGRPYSVSYLTSGIVVGFLEMSKVRNTNHCGEPMIKCYQFSDVQDVDFNACEIRCKKQYLGEDMKEQYVFVGESEEVIFYPKVKIKAERVDWNGIPVWLVEPDFRVLLSSHLGSLGYNCSFWHNWIHTHRFERRCDLYIWDNQEQIQQFVVIGVFSTKTDIEHCASRCAYEWSLNIL